MSAPVLIAYVSHDGQTARIAHRIGEKLVASGHSVDVVDLVRSTCTPEGVRAVVLGSSLRYGRHAKRLRVWIGRHRERLGTLPGSFFSVSLVAASTRDRDRGVADRLAADFLAAAGWRPDLVRCFGGALRYRQYGALFRLLMRRIAAKSGGSSDTSRNHDYTDWEAVDALAVEIAALLPPSAPTQS